MGTIDELTRLQSLLNDGAISQEEFEVLKKNVISESSTGSSNSLNQKKDLNQKEKQASFKSQNAILKEITCSNCGAELLFDTETGRAHV